MQAQPLLNAEQAVVHLVEGGREIDGEGAFRDGELFDPLQGFDPDAKPLELPQPAFARQGNVESLGRDFGSRARAGWRGGEGGHRDHGQGQDPKKGFHDRCPQVCLAPSGAARQGTRVRHPRAPPMHGSTQ